MPTEATWRPPSPVAKAVAYAIILPWVALVSPLVAISAAAEWWRFAAEERLAKRIAPANAAVARFAWRVGRRVG